MNLDELIKVAENPTPEIIEEVNKRVHEAATECGNNHQWNPPRTVFYPHASELYTCKICNISICIFDRKGPPAKELIAIPDYTKPENFWPLLDEILLKHNGELHYTECENRYKLYFGGMFQEDKIRHENPGLAVCLAYLKIKEQKNDA